MKDREVFDRRGWNFDARRRMSLQRERGEKRERQMTHGVAKFGAIRAVPGVNRIEGLECGDFCVIDDADQVKAGVGDRADFVGETDQRHGGARDPDFGVIGAGAFEVGKRKDHVPDRARTDE